MNEKNKDRIFLQLIRINGLIMNVYYNDYALNIIFFFKLITDNWEIVF